MRKPKLNSEYPTIPVLILIVISSLFILAMGINFISIAREALAAGRTYSVGIILDDTTMIYRDSSPGEYWPMIGLYIIGVVTMIGLGIFNLIGVIMTCIKKLARQKREKEAGRISNSNDHH